MSEQFITRDSGARQSFSSGAVRDVQTGKGRYDLLPPFAIRRLAQLFERGAVKYGDNNWKRGMPTNRFLDSAMRHIFCYQEGDRVEDHLIAAAWNLLCIVETQEMISRGTLPPDLDTLNAGEKIAPKKPANRLALSFRGIVQLCTMSCGGGFWRLWRG